jgi:hypothetical protein
MRGILHPSGKRPNTATTAAHLNLSIEIRL